MISLSQLSKNFFWESSFNVNCIQRNWQIVIWLFTNFAIRFGFMDEKFAKTVALMLELELEYLIKVKSLKISNFDAVQLIIYAIHHKLQFYILIESFTCLLIIKMGNYYIIFSRLLMKNHKVIIHIKNNALVLGLIISYKLKFFLLIHRVYLERQIK